MKKNLNIKKGLYPKITAFLLSFVLILSFSIVSTNIANEQQVLDTLNTSQNETHSAQEPIIPKTSKREELKKSHTDKNRDQTPAPDLTPDPIESQPAPVASQNLAPENSDNELETLAAGDSKCGNSPDPFNDFQFCFQVTMLNSNQLFYIPNLGGPNLTSYDWDIDWGDGSNENARNIQTWGGLGNRPEIKHRYALGKTYLITITAGNQTGINNGWFAAFGSTFNSSVVQATTPRNLNYVTRLISPIYPLMTRTLAQINDPAHNPIPDYEWTETFMGMTKLSMGDYFTFDPSAWSGIKEVGNHFAESMFSLIYDSFFNMGPNFNLPQNLEKVGDSFTAYMFDTVPNSSFTMNSIFNYPQTLTSVGYDFGLATFAGTGSDFNMNQVFTLPPNITQFKGYFAAFMFAQTYGTNFTMNQIFNLPQKFRKTDTTGFAWGMFSNIGSQSFQVNDMFKFPKFTNDELMAEFAFKETFDGLALVAKTRTAIGILNGNLVDVDDASIGTFETTGIWADIAGVQEHFGGGINVGRSTYQTVYEVNAPYVSRQNGWVRNDSAGSSSDGIGSGWVNEYNSSKISRTGYIFKEWNEEPDGSGKSYQGDDEIENIIGNRILYAIWAHTLTFDINGSGEGVSPSSILVADDAPIGELPTPNWDGQIFLGWFTSPSGGNKVTADTEFWTTSDATIFARWRPDIDNKCGTQEFGPYIYCYIVETKSDNESYILPTSGGDTDNGKTVKYNWDIAWDEGATPENKSGTSSLAQGNGISHKFATAGTHLISITPGNQTGINNGWLSAFGPYRSSGINYGGNDPIQLAKVTRVISPIYPQMTRTEAQIDDPANNAPPRYEWTYAFWNMINLEMGDNFNFIGWENITEVSRSFAAQMFEGNTNPSFNMNKVFNLPQNIRKVESNFASNMFAGVTSPVFTMNEIFNLPPKIEQAPVTVGKQMFSGVTGSKFNMNKVFNLPQKIQGSGIEIPSGMFKGVNSPIFQVNDVFKFPKLTAQPGGTVQDTFAFGTSAALQNRSPFAILNGNTAATDGPSQNIFAPSAKWNDLCAIQQIFGGATVGCQIVIYEANAANVNKATGWVSSLDITQTPNFNLISGNAGKLSREGYTFKEWNTKADGSGTSYRDGESIIGQNTSLLLYAIWNQKPDSTCGDLSFGPKIFCFEITTADPNETFIMPISNPHSFNWKIDWGDDSNPESVFGTGDYSFNGVDHSYQNPGTYLITITPGDQTMLIGGNSIQATNGWLSAFGFSAFLSGSSLGDNRNRVTKLLSPIYPEMTRTPAQLTNFQAQPSEEWANAFYGMKNPNFTMGENFTFKGWEGQTEVGPSFAEQMFYGVESTQFNMSKVFNLPTDFENIQQNFAAGMFNSVQSSTFTMGDDFNLPQSITTVGNNFAAYLFDRISSASFQVNSNFQFPQLSNTQLVKPGVFQGTLALGLGVSLQTKNTATHILNGNLVSTDVANFSSGRQTFQPSDLSIWSDLNSIQIWFGRIVNYVENSCGGQAFVSTSFCFYVDIKPNYKSFTIPTFRVDPRVGTIKYDWDINWGDGSQKENATGTAGKNTSGINHSYANPGTYLITIDAGNQTGINNGWFAAFGFKPEYEASGANSWDNKDALLKLISPIYPEMTRFGAQLSSPTNTTMPSNEWAYTFYGCRSNGNLFGENFNFEPTAWETIAYVGDNFAEGMFASSGALSFKMPQDFNLPQKIETVGKNFAKNMFNDFDWGGSSMNAVFNLPPLNKTKSDGFAEGMFSQPRVSGSQNFNMNEVFNLPQSNYPVGNNYVKNMFQGIVSSKFTMNSIFNLPIAITAISNGPVDSYAEGMFEAVVSPVFEMNSIFTFSQNVAYTAVGKDFGARMFALIGSSAKKFTMNEVFALPPNLTTIGDNFAKEMFADLKAPNFQVNSSFRLPAFSAQTLLQTGVYEQTFAFDQEVLLQNRNALAVLGENIDPGDGALLGTFGTSSSWRDICALPKRYGGEESCTQIVYDINGKGVQIGSGFFPNQSFIPGSNVKLIAANSSNLSSPGNSFIEWNTKPNGTGIAYKDGETINGLSVSLVLYAIWSIYDDSQCAAPTLGNQSFGPEVFCFNAATRDTFRSFKLPIGAALWDVDWGDGNVDTGINNQSAGVVNNQFIHTYASNAEFLITIVPNVSLLDTNAWLSAIAFSAGSLVSSNSSGLTRIISPIYPQMSRTTAQLDDPSQNTPPNSEWLSTFEKNINGMFTMGREFTFSGWEGIKTAGGGFAYRMFALPAGSSGSFKMSPVFNLPQDFEEVGSYFAYMMFYQAGGTQANLAPIFEMSPVFNLPPKIKTAGSYFGYQMFKGIISKNFTMNQVFNLPQDLETEDGYFATDMFDSVKSSSFVMNQVFNFPQKLTQVGNNFGTNLFNGVTSPLFNMNSKFTFPPNLTTVGKLFGSGVFKGVTSPIFQMNKVFNFPQNLFAQPANFADSLFEDITSPIFQVNNILLVPKMPFTSTLSTSWQATFKFGAGVPVQNRAAFGVLNGNRIKNDVYFVNYKTFTSQAWQDLCAIQYTFGGNGETCTVLALEPYKADVIISANGLWQNTFLISSTKRVPWDASKELSYLDIPFTEWNTEPDGTGKSYQDTDEVNINLVSTVLYPIFGGSDKYEVGFVNGGGVGQANIQKFIVGAEPKELNSSVEFTKSNSYQIGWSETNNASVAQYELHEKVKDLVLKDERLVLYAVWAPNKYSVKFDANGGTSTLGTLSNLVSGVNTQLPSIAGKVSKTGYTFQCWASTNYGNCSATNGTVFADEANISRPVGAFNNGSVFTLYAIWKANEYTLNFHANGGTDGAASMPSQNLTFGVSHTLEANKFAKNGQSFLGWALSAADANNGIIKLKDKATFATISPAPANGGTLDLYAVWFIYYVHFEGGGAPDDPEIDPITPDQAFGLTEYKNLNANQFVWPGYTFLGWDTDGNGTVDYADTANVGELTTIQFDKLTFTAIWQANNYEITFVGGAGSSGNIGPVSGFTYNTEANLPNQSITKSGYTLQCWSTENPANITGSIDCDQNQGSKTFANSANTKIKTPLPAPAVNNGNLNLYAIWSGANYSVKFNKNATDATGTENTQSGFVYGVKKELAGTRFQRTGYTLLGWSTSSGTSNSVDYDFNDEVTNLSNDGSTASLYAVWQAITYNVTFDPGENGQSLLLDLKNLTYGVSNPASLIPNAAGKISRSGFTFECWSTLKTTAAGACQTPNGTTIFGDNTNIVTISPAPESDGETLTLYAVWGSINYSVRFNNGGGIGAQNTQSGFVSGTSKSLASAVTYTKAGSHQIGWSTTDGDISPEFTLNQSVTALSENNNATIDLYAVWEANQYSVTFDANGGSGAQSTQTGFYYGKNQKLNPSVKYSRPGYTQQGWVISKTATAADYTNNEIVQDLSITNSGNVILYAFWVPNNYNIVFQANGGIGNPTMNDQYGLEYNKAEKISKNTYEWASHLFAGWAYTQTDAQLGIVEFTDEAIIKTPSPAPEKGRNVTLWAVWYNYLVHFNPGSGVVTGSMTDQAFALGDIKNLLANRFERIGYTFKGWAITGGNTVVYQDEFFVNSDLGANQEIVNLTAVWEANTYTVQFDKNTRDLVTGGAAPQPFIYDQSQKLTQNSFEREGFNFIGWSETPGSALFDFRDEANKTNLVTSGVKTLYAVWEAKPNNTPKEPEETPAPSPSLSPSPSPSPSLSPSPTPSPSVTPTPTPKPKPTLPPSPKPTSRPSTKPTTPPKPAPLPETTLKIEIQLASENEVWIIYKSSTNGEVTLNNITNTSSNYKSIFCDKSESFGEGKYKVVCDNIVTGSYQATLTENGKTYSSKFQKYDLEFLAKPYKFTDLKKVPKERKKDIEWLSKAQITSGMGCDANGGGKKCKYAPANPVNRGAMAQFLRKLASSPETSQEIPQIKDLQKLDIGRATDIKWLAAEGITVVNKEVKYKYNPTNPVNRGAMAQFMWKLAGSPAYNESDLDKVAKKANLAKDKALSKLKKTNSDRYYNILWLAQQNITYIDPKVGKYNPSNIVNRGAMAQFMRKLYYFMVTGQKVPDTGIVP